MKTTVKTTALLMAILLLFAGGLLCVAAQEPENAFSPGELSGFGELYAYVLSQLENGSPDDKGVLKVDVRDYGLTTQNVTAFRNVLRYHNPQLFYWAGSMPYSYSGGRVVSLSFPFTVSAEELEEKKARYEEMLAPLCALRDDGWSDLETVIFYSDCIAANYAYDLNYENYDAYSFLDEGVGVCQAYTALFMQLMNRFGIPCTCASSESINHIWNVVYVDGAWYHLDITHNDPTYDRPGRAAHECTLTGTSTTVQLKNAFAARIHREFSDLTLGLPIQISEDDHPVRAWLKGSVSPVVPYEDGFYTILQGASAGASATLVRADLSSNGYEVQKYLAGSWRVPGQTSMYPGNFSSLASDGVYLYFFDDTTLYAYDVQSDDLLELLDAEENTDIYGMQYQNGTLTYFTAVSPNEETYEGHILDELPRPVYYTITWIIGEECISAKVRKGSDPMEYFNGSTELEDEGGYSFVFTGWSPQITFAEEDATYTAQYEIRQNYIDGDINADGKVDISDVTALLLILAGVEESPDTRTDVNRDGSVNIADVTELLAILSGAVPFEAQ